MLGPPGGPPPAPSGSVGPVAEDWGLALVLGLYPLVGLTLAAGDALTLLGVAIIVGVGIRLPESAPLHRPILASGICVLLAVLCLLLPSVDWTGPAALGSAGASGLVRMLLAGVLACALLRGAAARATPLGLVDGVAAVAGIGAAGTVIWLVARGEIEAARALGGLVVSLGLVFGIQRLYLGRSRRLGMLARAGAVGVLGAVLVAFIRIGVA